jgi:hypothetical protein
MSEFERYPMLMVHPNYRKAQLEKVNPELSNARSDWRQTSPEKYPPVTVNTEDQEAHHAAAGYQPNGKGDPAAYAEAHADAVPEDYEAEQYPKWVHGVLVEDEDGELQALEAYEQRQATEAAQPAPTAPEPQKEPQNTDLAAMIAQAVAQALAAEREKVAAERATAEDDADDYLEPEQRRGPGRPRKVY